MSGLGILASTNPFKALMTHIDYLVLSFKFWLEPKHFLKESALACDISLVNLNENSSKLADLFIKLDRVQGTEKIQKVFPGFPQHLTLVQFLQICEAKNLKFEDFCTDEILADLEKHEKIVEKLKENKEKNLKIKALEKEKIDKEVRKQGLLNTEQVLVKEKKEYQEKIKKNKSERYLFVLARIDEELKEIQRMKKSY